MQQQRQQLAPYVTRWKQFEVKAAAFQKHKTTFLQQQTHSLHKEIETGSSQVCRQNNIACFGLCRCHKLAGLPCRIVQCSTHAELALHLWEQNKTTSTAEWSYCALHLCLACSQCPSSGSFQVGTMREELAMANAVRQQRAVQVESATSKQQHAKQQQQEVSSMVSNMFKEVVLLDPPYLLTNPLSCSCCLPFQSSCSFREQHQQTGDRPSFYRKDIACW